MENTCEKVICIAEELSESCEKSVVVLKELQNVLQPKNMEEDNFVRTETEDEDSDSKSLSICSEIFYGESTTLDTDKNEKMAENDKEETINLIEEDVRQTGDSATDQAPFVIDEELPHIETKKELPELVIANLDASIVTQDLPNISEDNSQDTVTSSKKNHDELIADNKKDVSEFSVNCKENGHEHAVNSRELVRKHSVNSVKSIEETSVNSIRNIQKFAINFAKKIQGSTPPVLLMKELKHSPNSLTTLSNSVLEKSIGEISALKFNNKLEDISDNGGRIKSHKDASCQCECNSHYALKCIGIIFHAYMENTGFSKYIKKAKHKQKFINMMVHTFKTSGLLQKHGFL